MIDFPFRLLSLDEQVIQEALGRAFEEDLGKEGDITSLAIFEDHPELKSAAIVAKGEGVVCGSEIARKAFLFCDEKLDVRVLVHDGREVKSGVVLLTVRGNAASILRAERVALNFLGFMSGIATKTRRIVKRLEGKRLRVLDTRKTLPGLRVFEKYAVSVGGGYNHRYGLYDMILIKENHRAAAGGITVAVERARKRFPSKVIEVEVSTLEEVKEALQTSADIIMLDNMDNEEIARAVELIGSKKYIEASGNMTEERIVLLSEMGVDFVSMGGLTHTIQPLDVSLLMEDFL